jgi:hypothetical protein
MVGLTKICFHYYSMLDRDWKKRVMTRLGSWQGFGKDVALYFVISINITIFSAQFQARPLFKDRRKFPQMADPALEGRYPARGLYQALAVAAMCVQEQPTMRPVIGDVVTALSYLASQTYDPEVHGVHRTSRSVAPGTPPRARNHGAAHQ